MLDKYLSLLSFCNAHHRHSPRPQAYNASSCVVSQSELNMPRRNAYDRELVLQRKGLGFFADDSIDADPSNRDLRTAAAGLQFARQLDSKVALLGMVLDLFDLFGATAVDGADDDLIVVRPRGPAEGDRRPALVLRRDPWPSGASWNWIRTGSLHAVDLERGVPDRGDDGRFTAVKLGMRRVFPAGDVVRVDAVSFSVSFESTLRGMRPKAPDERSSTCAVEMGQQQVWRLGGKFAGALPPALSTAYRNAA